MNDNEGVAEMLIDSLGTTIVNTTDSKGRWEMQRDANDIIYFFKFVGGDYTLFLCIVNCVCLYAGPPFTLQLSPTTWSVSPFCWATEHRQM